MPLKVLHTITGMNIGGAERMLLRFAQGVDRRQWAPTILSLLPRGTLQDDADAVGVPVVNLSAARGGISISAAAQLRRRVREQAPDLIHGWMYHGDLAGSLSVFGRRDAPPVIWSIHHSLTSLANERPLTRATILGLSRLSSNVSAISYCSKASAAQHEAVGFDPRKTVVIPNGTDCDVFKPSASAGATLRTLIGAPAGRLIVGHVARAHPMKDQGQIAHVIAELRARGIDAQAVIIGEGHQNGAIESAARERGVDDRITLLGARRDVSSLAPGFDLYLLSSKWGEAFPLAVAEAMASGVPAVVTDVGDCAWLVGDADLVAPPGDAAALAARCAAVLTLDDRARRKLGTAARARIVEKFGLDEYVRQHLELYEEALADRRQRLAS